MKIRGYRKKARTRTRTSSAKVNRTTTRLRRKYRRKIKRSRRHFRRKITRARTLGPFNEKDQLLVVKLATAVDFADGNSLFNVQNTGFWDNLLTQVQNEVKDDGITMVKLKSYGLAVSAPKRIIRATEPGTSGATATTTNSFVAQKFELYCLRDYRGDLRDPSKDAPTGDVFPTLAAFTLPVRNVVDHPKSRLVPYKGQITMRRKVRGAPWMNWSTQRSRIDQNKTVKANLTSSNSFLDWLKELLPQRVVNLPQAPNQTMWTAWKTKVPPYGNYPCWMIVAPQKQFSLEDGETLHYHAFLELTMWIRLGIRRRTLVATSGPSVSISNEIK